MVPRAFFDLWHPVKTTTFKLSTGNEFIPLDKLLKLIGAVGSGGEAHAIISDGLVQVNNEVEMQKRKKLRAGDSVQFNGETIQVEA